MTYAQPNPDRIRREHERLERLEDLLDRLQDSPEFKDDPRVRAAIAEELGDSASGETLTMDGIREMSQEEIIERKSEVEAAMAASGGGAPTRPPEPVTIEDVRALTDKQILDNGWLARCQEIMAKQEIR